MIEQGELFKLFDLDVEQGRLFWKSPPKNHPRLLGREAGSNRRDGIKTYCVVKINGTAFKRGHIIFCMVNGWWPKPMLDHKDGNSTNDIPSNLREATATENAWNHKRRSRRIPLPMGVRRNKSGSYSARIGYNGSQVHLGSYPTPDEAEAVYREKRKELYGKFA